MATPVQDAIVLFGDSITQDSWVAGGLCQRLAELYVGKFDVMNRGIEGYNTDWAIPVLEQCLVRQHDQVHSQKVRLLIMWFGANDACLPPSNQHVPLERYGKNLVHLIRMVTDPQSAWFSPATRVILITPPPINTYQRAHKTNRSFAATVQYAQKTREVASQEHVHVVDAWQAMWDASGQQEKALSKYLSDGLHFTADGYQIVFNELIAAIRKHYPELYIDRLKSVFADWDEVGANDPSKSLVEGEIIGGQI